MTGSFYNRRLHLDLSVEAYQLLQQLANESETNLAEVWRTGLALYPMLKDCNPVFSLAVIAQGAQGKIST
jgi:hypothetical protein